MAASGRPRFDNQSDCGELNVRPARYHCVVQLALRLGTTPHDDDARRAHVQAMNDQRVGICSLAHARVSNLAANAVSLATSCIQVLPLVLALAVASAAFEP